MSIFFIDKKAKIAMKSSKNDWPYKSFSKEKNNTELIQRDQYHKNLQVIPQCPQLKQIREAFDYFSQVFERFNQQNGPAITGAYLSDAFLRFKSALEPFLYHATHFYNTPLMNQRVQSYSPILDFASQMLHEWSRLIRTMNRLASSEILPQLCHIREHISMIDDSLRGIAGLVVIRNVYHDEMYSASKFLSDELHSIYDNIYKTFNMENEDGLSESSIEHYKNQLIRFLRNFESNYIGILPSYFTNMPRMTRKRMDIKSSISDTITLLTAAYNFRHDTCIILDRMCDLHRAICKTLKKLKVSFHIEVIPNGYIDIEEEEEESPEPEQNLDQYVDNLGKMLKLNLENTHSTQDRMELVETMLKKLMHEKTSPKKSTNTKNSPSSADQPIPFVPPKTGQPVSIELPKTTFSGLPIDRTKNKHKKTKKNKKVKKPIHLEISEKIEQSILIDQPIVTKSSKTIILDDNSVKSKENIRSKSNIEPQKEKLSQKPNGQKLTLSKSSLVSKTNSQSTNKIDSHNESIHKKNQLPPEARGKSKQIVNDLNTRSEKRPESTRLSNNSKSSQSSISSRKTTVPRPPLNPKSESNPPSSRKENQEKVHTQNSKNVESFTTQPKIIEIKEKDKNQVKPDTKDSSITSSKQTSTVNKGENKKPLTTQIDKVNITSSTLEQKNLFKQTKKPQTSINNKSFNTHHQPTNLSDQKASLQKIQQNLTNKQSTSYQQNSLNKSNIQQTNSKKSFKPINEDHKIVQNKPLQSKASINLKDDNKIKSTIKTTKVVNTSKTQEKPQKQQVIQNENKSVTNPEMKKQTEKINKNSSLKEATKNQLNNKLNDEPNQNNQEKSPNVNQTVTNDELNISTTNESKKIPIEKEKSLPLVSDIQDIDLAEDPEIDDEGYF